jgi:hypothetical protein
MDHLKTIAEVGGTICTLVSLFLMGRPDRGQRIGLWISTAGVVPWTTFAIVTHSWVMLAQTWLIVGFNLYNLHLAKVRNAQPA